jgi:hypothetical protein
MNCNSVKAQRAICWRSIAFGVFLLCNISGSGLANVYGFDQEGKSIARIWNEQLLWAIRLDSARPTVHARNLFHLSAAMWDAWAAYHPDARGVFVDEQIVAEDIAAARHESISFAAYRLLMWRFKNSPNFIQTESSANRKMAELGYDVSIEDVVSTTPGALGNRIAQTIIETGLLDGANELNDYENQFYEPVNPPLNPARPGNPEMTSPNRWQPLDIPDFVGQSGEQSENYPPFVGPEWGNVKPFSLTDQDMTTRQRDGKLYRVYLDPGSPPLFGFGTEAQFRDGFEQVIKYSSRLDPEDGLVIDVSPASRGNNRIGSNDGSGYEVNPVTGQPYQPQWVLAGDYFRVLAEFWADGPSSETPPGHWFVMLNFASDRLKTENKQFRGAGEVLDNLEWDVRAYLAMGGAMHDVAIAAWSNKGWYDYTRPISAIRFLCEQGQRSDLQRLNFNPQGIDLIPGLIELIDKSTTAPGGRHAHLLAQSPDNLGEIAVKSWRGPDFIDDVNTDTAGVGWILCKNWWPYQRPNFVTPPFAGYVSGHSTYSRAAAEILTLLTGSQFFPDGYAIFRIKQDTFLKFERGPSKPFSLQWATYQDAADESAISRIYGGIHPPGDDIPGRMMGYRIGHQAFKKALEYYPPNKLN